MRADLVVARTAVANAAWRGSDVVAEEDIPDRRRTGASASPSADPFDDPGIDPEQLEAALSAAADTRSERAREPDLRWRTIRR